MGIINPTYVNPGDEITADSVNNPIQTITNLVNGNIDSDNLKDDSITAPKIANEAITGEKIASKTVAQSNIDFSTLDFGNYSTTETDTRFTWIDGEKIYKKTVDFGALPNTGTKDVAHGISNISYIVKIEGTMRTPTIFFTLDKQGGSTPFASVGGFEVTTANIRSTTTTDRSTFSAIITLYYTKTT